MVLVLLFLFGLIFGSNKGRSLCPNCKNQISWRDNIPLFSYLLLGGKCRNCKKHISLRYPLIELSTALGLVLIGYYATTFKGGSFQDVYSIIFFLVLFLILEAIFIIDLEHRIIPDSFVFIGLLFSLFTIQFSPFTVHGSLFVSLFAGFLAATLLLFIHLFTKGRGMGLGDVKFAVLGGFLVGPKLLLIWLFLAFFIGAVIGIAMILNKRAKLKSQIAFGPFLVIAIPLAIIYGERILAFIHIN
jgi:prepilin signal peptidase PulO-like enzyme (type II secretory pathway)